MLDTWKAHTAPTYSITNLLPVFNSIYNDSYDSSISGVSANNSQSPSQNSNIKGKHTGAIVSSPPY